MTRTLKALLSLLVWILLCSYVTPAFSNEHGSLIGVTPGVREYATHTVKPDLDNCTKKDRLSLLLKVSDVLIHSETGIQKNAIDPSTYMIYDQLNKIGLGFLATLKLSSEQKTTLKAWHSKYMQKNPADVFFAPSADDIITSKAAFGCSHYARSFIAVVKALDLIDTPEDVRYVISSKADNYNEALETNDKEKTINGHQFVMVKIGAQWITINTSKSEWTAMPEGFSPDRVSPPGNIPIRFASYPDVTFLLRWIGTDYDDDGNDDSLASLMNIYRSGDADNPDFKWERFIAAEE